ncbi:hypothetical protein ACFQY5_14480 [Paeniroseomonas aquatica]|uniref:DUF2939 domain-containing protein n=1 Tax=Paeniroseomonas aquatica TaxID=373043 RepID=A0ABT8A732_9PROT|nr:hypothetical protein [Paeniroseomonas aquatica]MDN3565519.1 hypothetical protein [Paeniroseomonas aquatica]
MSRGVAARADFPEQAWNEVWSLYDARMAATAPARPVVPQPTACRRHGRMRAALAAVALLLPLAAAGFAMAALQSAQGIAEAFRQADRAAVAAAVDWPALRTAMPPPPATTPAGHFLAGLHRIVQQQMATPEGLLALVQGRAGPGWPAPRLEPTGIRTARLTLLSTAEAGRGIALSLALRPDLPPRWRVVAVEPLD